MLKISLYFFLDIFQHVFKIVYQFVLLSCGAECEYCCYCCSCTLIFFMLRQLVYLLFKFCFTKFCHPKFCNFAYNFWILSFKFLFLTSKKFSFWFLVFFCFVFVNLLSWTLHRERIIQTWPRGYNFVRLSFVSSLFLSSLSFLGF